MHALRLRLHQAQVLAALLLIERKFAQGFEKAGQHRERRLELMRHIGHKVTASGFQAFQLGNVARHEQALSHAIRNKLHLKHLV